MTQIYNSPELKYGLPPQIAAQLDAAGLSEVAEQLYFLHQQAFQANCELGILKTLDRVSEEFEDQLKCAGCFFSYSKVTLVESILMNCAKLFDGKSYVSIYSLVNVCKRCSREMRDCFENNGADEGSCRRRGMIKHLLHPSEECFYKAEVSRQRAFDGLFQNSECGIKASSPVYISIDLDDLLALYEKRLNGLSKKKKAVRAQRNKLYAHNGREALDFSEAVTGNDVTYSDIEGLLEFALDITEELMAILSGVRYSRVPVNLHDIEGLLCYAKAGMKAIYDSQACMSSVAEHGVPTGRKAK